MMLYFKAIVATIVILFIMTICASFFCGCTYNVSMVHTDGTASDVIDTVQETKTDANANLSVPI
jgi:hypothetical protein